MGDVCAKRRQEKQEEEEQPTEVQGQPADDEEDDNKGDASPRSPVPAWGRSMQRGRMLGQTMSIDLPPLPGESLEVPKVE